MEFQPEAEQPIFYIGHHETDRSYPVTDEVLDRARECNYDMLTSPITTDHFRGNVISLIQSHFEARQALGNDLDIIPYPLVPPLTPLDTHLTPNDTVSNLIAATSPWIDLASPDPIIAHVSRQVFSQEIAYAAFCGITNILIQGPGTRRGEVDDGSLAQYARAIQEAINTGIYLQLHILLPMAGTDEASPKVEGHVANLVRAEYVNSDSQNSNSADAFGSWDSWNIIRSVCKYSARLGVALILPKRLPPTSLQSRWFSEPLRILNLPDSSFLSHARGSQVLSKPHQLFIIRCMKLRTAPWLLLSGVGPIPGLANLDMALDGLDGVASPGLMADALSPASSTTLAPTPAEAANSQRSGSKKNNDPTPHLSYLRYLQRNQPPRPVIEKFGTGYQDYLQSPLQPLADNLESVTYEVFEKDPIKYEWYEKAVENALRDWKPMGKTTSSGSDAVVVAVAGAGRGPLVTRAIQASQKSGVPIKLYAVEKNPNAYVLLQRHNLKDWNHQVTIIKSDMRSWKGPLLADGTHSHVDILVSELLGSFADNELSPECLDGVQHVLNPTHGISVPSSYTAHYTPISASRLHSDITSRIAVDPSAFELPYVVMLHAIDYLSTTTEAFPAAQGTNGGPLKAETALMMPDVKQAWEFNHPVPPSVLTQSNLRRGGGITGGGGSGAAGGDGVNEHNNRFSRLKFACKNRGVCNGLGGYFETVLYAGSQGAVELSTNPVTMDQKSKDMISWFPIFFPLKCPLYVPDNSELEISMWRQTDDRKVWYEWLVEVFVVIGGKRIRLGASELHSSRKNGCLM